MINNAWHTHAHCNFLCRASLPLPIDMWNGQFYYPYRNGPTDGPPIGTQYHLCFPDPFCHALTLLMECSPPPPLSFCQKLLKSNKSLLGSVGRGGAGSTQMQIQSYHTRQSGNLARNTDPGCIRPILYGEGLVYCKLSFCSRTTGIYS